MPTIVYGLCALTALACAFLLLRAYFKQHYRLLLWSGLCFSILALNNLLLVLDKIVFPVEGDLSIWRAGTALVAIIVLLYGLIWDAQ